MPPRILADVGQLDLGKPEVTIEGIRKFNRQRYEMEQLDCILRYDEEAGIVVGLKDVRDDEFWVRGHIPGQPVMPGVLICECAAQLCSYFYLRLTGSEVFMGFGGMENVKFRRIVVPGDRLVMIAKRLKIRPRVSFFETQGVVDGKLVFEAVINGIEI